MPGPSLAALVAGLLDQWVGAGPSRLVADLSPSLAPAPPWRPPQAGAQVIFGTFLRVGGAVGEGRKQVIFGTFRQVKRASSGPDVRTAKGRGYPEPQLKP